MRDDGFGVVLGVVAIFASFLSPCPLPFLGVSSSAVVAATDPSFAAVEFAVEPLKIFGVLLLCYMIDTISMSPLRVQGRDVVVSHANPLELSGLQKREGLSLWWRLYVWPPSLPALPVGQAVRCSKVSLPPPAFLQSGNQSPNVV